MVAHQAPLCTSATVTMVAHQGVETFTRSSSLVQLCTMQHQDTFTMVTHTAASHSATPCSTTDMLPHALTALLALLSSFFSLHHYTSTTSPTTTRKRKAEGQEHRMAKMARHLPPPPPPGRERPRIRSTGWPRWRGTCLPHPPDQW